MAYHKNDLEVEVLNSSDAREDDGYDDTYRLNGLKVAMLPHSCDDWIIGGREEVEQMIKDLQLVLEDL